MTLKEAKELIGTVWNRDGDRRKVLKVADGGEVFWCHPDSPEQVHRQWLPYFTGWVARAKQE